jgi:HEAT repeat protein
VSFLFPSSTITIEAALRDLAGGSPKARAFAAHALGDVTDPTERARAVDALITALEDDRPEVRAEAASSLGDLREPSAIPLLVKRLDDGVAAVRQNAAIALGTIGHGDAFEPLAEALREGPADLRFQAATSLAEIDPARAFDPLVAALGDRDPQVVGAAALSLGAIGNKRAIAVLAPVIDHRDPGARFDAAYALAELGDATGQGILVEAVGDAERAWDAVTALATLGATATSPSAARAVEALGRALTDRRVPPEATVLAAGRLLEIAPASPHDDAARRVLLAALQARKTHVRGLAVEQLQRCGGEWAKAPLEKLARSGKGGELLEAIASALEAIAKREAR